MPSLEKQCKISDLWLPSLDKYVYFCSCLGRPSHERRNSWQGSNVESLYPEKFQDLESQVLNSAIIVKTWGHGVARKCNISKLGKPSLEKKCKISELWLPSLEKYFHMCSCLGRPSHERHNSWQGSDVEILYPEKFQDLESQVLNSAVIVKTWGHGVAKKVTFQNLGYQVLKKCKISELWLPSLEKYFHMCSCLGRPSHERPNSWQGSNVESLYPEKFQDLESQVLNSAIIVKTWGHGVARKCNISKLGKPSLEKTDFRTWSAKS